jgi:hypothetical protein
MTGDERPNDRVLDVVASLRTHDVSERHARRLRRRCHARLRTQAWTAASAMDDASVFRRIVGPALGGAWCLAYLVELLRRVAEVYVG